MRAAAGGERVGVVWKMAWRNLWRHRTRTLIMGSAVAFIYGLTLVGLGINDDGHRRMLEEAAAAAGGDVLVHGEGYWSTRAGDRVVRDGGRVLETVRSQAGVRVAIPRVLVSGLLSTSTGSSPVSLRGVDPTLEAELSDPARDLARGAFLAGGRDDPLVVGAGIAETLELELGDRVVLTASDPDGELVRALFHLTGVLETGTRELDESLAYTTLEGARSAVGMEGMLTQVGVLTAGEDVSREVAEAVRSALERASLSGLEVLTWRQAVPEMVGFVELDEAFGVIYMMVLLVVVLFSITNTFLMAVMERVRELGLLNALGLRGGGIGRLLLAETVLLTGLSMGAGFVLGYGAHRAVNHWGISMAISGLEQMEISGIDFADLVFYSTLDPWRWTVATALVAGATVASALYPAWRASRLAPAEAMRFYE